VCLLRTGSRSPAIVRLFRRLSRRCAPFDSFPQQPGVDFLGAQICKRRIDQRPGRKRETVRGQNRIDGQVGGFVPESRIAFSAAALVAQRTVKDFMGERSLKFRWLELIYEGGVIDNPRSVRRHRGQIARYQFQSQTECAEKRLREQELNPSPS
jgi:hypothetical protein